MAVYYPEARIAIRAYFENFGPTPGDGEAPATFHAKPRSFTIQRTARHLPDTWSVEFDYESFPVDPDVVRAAAVEIWLWDKLSLTNKTQFVDQPGSQLGALRTALEQGGSNKPGPAIYGMVKEASAQLDGQSRVVRLDGEDYTSLFAKHRFHVRPGDKIKSVKKKVRARDSSGKVSNRTKTFKVYRKVNLTQPIVQIFKDFISEVDPFGIISLRVDAPALKASPSSVIKGLTRLQQKGTRADQDDNYWDVMNKVARMAGLSVYVENTQVVLADAQTLYKESGVQPYVMRYGGPQANIQNLSLKRDMGKNVSPQVAVHAYDPKTREIIIEKYPVNAQQVVTSGYGWKRDEQQIIPVTGITDKATLQALARDKFERTCRGEREVVWSTVDMQDAPDPGEREPFDLTKIRSGEPAYVMFDPLGLDLSGMTTGQRVAALSDRGYSAQVSQLIADAYGKKSDFNFPFYVKEAKLQWSAESGFELEVSSMDYSSPGGIRGS